MPHSGWKSELARQPTKLLPKSSALRPLFGTVLMSFG
jgi:hypothetical protein